MRNLSRNLIPFTFLLAVIPAVRADEAQQPPRGFVALFNGKDLIGWHGMPHFDPYKLEAMPEADRKAQIEKWTADAKKHWTVENGELVNDGKGAYLTTDKDYGDIELLVEYKTVPKADSGIYLRATPQVQIWDYTKEGGKWNLGADKGSGGLWNNSAGAPGKDPLVLADKPFGQWNSFRILMVGERVTVYLNDKLVVDHARLENFWKRKPPLALPRQAPIQLQTHGGEIRWRNMFIREIPAAEANEMLRKHGTQGFESVFNGTDFTGWAGPVDQYEVKDGAIVCKPKKGGTIYTKDQYGDFVARVEFKLPPGGNNGLAIRYPGKGDTAYVGMCEVQVLDDTAKGHAKLDPRQYNGSVYGIVASQRGYLRPVGEWNFEEVTVKGPTIKVELNGTVILNADVSKVTDYMAKSPHPGKDRTWGHFGFAGHNDPVAFRNIEIKRPETTKPLNRDLPQHKKINEAAAKGDIDLIFLGDSITAGWAGNGKDLWKKYYEPRKALNAGIGGDRTQHILWRLDNGNIDGLTPKLVVLMIGTNNIKTNTPADIAAGIKSILLKLNDKLPKTKVLLLGVFPRGEKPDSDLRKTEEAINNIIKDYADGKMVHYLNINAALLNSDGTQDRAKMPDLVHLTAPAYAIWAESIEAKVAELLGEKSSSAKPQTKAKGKAPTLANVPYGEHERQVLDFYKAESAKPTPLIFFIHGGGWVAGDKSGVGNLTKCLDAGISLVAINYRYSWQAQLAGVKPPVEWPLHDAARALQFVRSKASEWNIDKQRIGATGGSAGACSSLWLAFHDDMADPKSSDPIARESTRLGCAAVTGAQTSLDPLQLREWTPNSRYGGHAFGFMDPKDLKSRDTQFSQFLAARSQLLPWIKEYSPYELVSADDPPIYLHYAAAPALGKEQKDPTHTANYGVKLQEKLRSVGVECEFAYPGAPDVTHEQPLSYLIDKLKAPARKKASP